MARRPHLVVFLLFLVLCYLVRLGTGHGLLTGSYAGDLAEDAGQFIWHFAHLKRALLGQADLFWSEGVFYPVGLQMVRQDWAPAAGLLALPFQVLGPLAALNLQVLSAFVLCGFCTYLLAWHLCQDRVLAFAAGIIFAFCEFRMDKSFGHINQANQQFVPLFVLFVWLYFERGMWRHALGAAASFFLATFCTYYQSVFLALFLLLFVLLRLVWAAGPAVTGKARWPAALRPVVLRATSFGLLFCGATALLLGPVLLNYWGSYRLAARSLTGYMPEYSADLLSYVQSSFYTPDSQRAFSAEGGTAFLGYSVLALVILSLATVKLRTGAGIWLVLALAFFVLSLGSTLVVGRRPICPLPFFQVLQDLPVVRGAKVAARFSSMVVLFSALAGCMALTRLVRPGGSGWLCRRSRLIRAGVLVAVCAELCLPAALYTQRSLPIPFPVPAIYPAIRELRQKLPLVHVPLVWDTFSGHIGPHRFPRQLWAYQTLHEQPIMSGIGNMVPRATLRYFLRAPLLGQLIQLQQGQALAARWRSEKHRRDARHTAAVLGLRLVVVYKQLKVPGRVLVRERYEEPAAYLSGTLDARVAYQDRDLMLFVLPPPRPDEVTTCLDLSGEGSLAHLGGAWQRTVQDGEWVAETSLSPGLRRELYLRLPGRRGRTPPLQARLKVRCAPGPCRLLPHINGWPLAPVQLLTGWQEVKLSLPRHALRPGLNRLRLSPDRISEADGGSFPVGRTGVRTPLALWVLSAGNRAGNLASIRLGGLELAPGGRGYNVVALHPRSGQVLARASFDLVTDGSRGRALAQLVRGLPPGSLVCVAVRDDGSINLTTEVVSALRSAGAGLDLHGQHRVSYAMVGVRGAAPGTALERLSTEQADVQLGPMLQLRALEVGQCLPDPGW